MRTKQKSPQNFQIFRLIAEPFIKIDNTIHGPVKVVVGNLVYCSEK